MVQTVPVRVFLVGCARSGTTLMQAMLAQHPRLVTFPESHFFDTLARNRVRRVPGAVRGSAWHQLAEFAEGVGGQPPRRTFVARRLVRDFVRCLDDVTTERGGTHWLEKTPHHLHRIATIKRHVPNARFVHLVREGKDVVASLYDVTRRYPERWGGPRSLDRCIDEWLQSIEITRRLEDRHDHFAVRYEDLIRDPPDVLRSTCTFLALRYVDAMAQSFQKSVDDVALAWEPWKREVAGDLDSNRAAKFGRLFDSEQQAHVLQRLEGADYKPSQQRTG